MSSTRSLRSFLLRGPALAVLALALLGLVYPISRAQDKEKEKEKPGKLTAKSLQALLAAYKTERAAADMGELTKKVSPVWFEKADALAKQGAAALKAGRLIEARDALRRAPR